MKEPLVLIGGGGHCKSCIDVIEMEGRFEIVGVLDIADKIGEKVLGYTIIGSDHDISRLSKEVKNFLVTVGQLKNQNTRMTIYTMLKNNNACLPVIISPLAYVSRHSTIKEGTIVMHHALINADATIGVNCIINNKALVEHDAVIGDHCHISTASVVNGGVVIGSGTFYGSGAVSKQYIDIPVNSFINANSIVTGR